MASEPSTERVVGAITALYNSPDPSVKTEANAWLNSLAASPQAWPLCSQIVADSSSSDDVKFFCANLLLSKVQSGWATCPPELRAQLQTHFLALLSQYLSSGAEAIPPLVSSRVLRIVAAICIRAKAASAASPAAAREAFQEASAPLLGVDALVDQSLQQAAALQDWVGPVGQKTALVLCSVLQAIADECEDSDRAVQCRVLPLLRPRFSHVASFLNTFLSHLQHQPQYRSLTSSALSSVILTLLSWVRLDFLSASLPPITAVHVSAGQPVLWQALLATIGSPSDGVRDTTVECLVNLLGCFDPSTSSATSAPGTDPEELLTSQLIKALLDANRRGAMLESLGGDRVSLNRALCCVAVAVAERNPDYVAGPQGGKTGQALVCLVLDVVSAPVEAGSLEAVCDAAVEFFTALCVVPTVERRPEMQGNAYLHLAMALLSKGSFPNFGTAEEWKDWWEADSDEFFRFRDYVLVEGLLISAPVLKGQLYPMLLGAYQGAQSWQQAETVLFALQALGRTVRQSFPTASGKGDTAPAAVAAEYFQDTANADLSHCIGRIFQELAAEGDTGGTRFPPQQLNAQGAFEPLTGLLAKSGVQALGTFSEWFLLNTQLLPGVLRYILRAFTDLAALSTLLPLVFSLVHPVRCGGFLQAPSAVSSAAEAFKAMATTCALQLSSADTVLSLITAAQDAVIGPKAEAPDGLTLFSKQRVVEGLALLASGVPVQQAPEVLQLLVGPHLSVAAELASQPVPSSPQHRQRHSELLAEQFQLTATVARTTAHSFESEAPWDPSERPSANRQAAPAQHPAQHPCMSVLGPCLRVLGPVLSTPYWRSCEPVATSACELHTALLLALQRAFLPYAAPVLALHMSLFQEHPLPACLQFVSRLIEISVGRNPPPPAPAPPPRPESDGLAPTSPPDAATLGSALIGATSKLQTIELSTAPEAAAAYFELLNRSLIFNPGLIAQCDILAATLQLASSTLAQTNAEACRSTVAFLAHVFSPGISLATAATSEWERIRQQLIAAMVQQNLGSSLVASVLTAAAGVAPREIIRSLAGVLREAILMAGPQTGASWLSTAVRRSDFVAVAGGRVGDSELRILVGALLGAPPVPKMLFGALMLDFSSVCRAEGTPDLLLAYEGRVGAFRDPS